MPGPIRQFITFAAFALATIVLLVAVALRATRASADQRHPAATVVTQHYRPSGRVKVECAHRDTHTGITECTARIDENMNIVGTRSDHKHVSHLYVLYHVGVAWAPLPHIAWQKLACVGLVVNKTYSGLSYLARHKNGTLTAVYYDIKPGVIYWTCGLSK